MITAKLISPRDMYEAIQDMTQSIRERRITGALYFKTPGEIYGLKNFEVARHGQDVIIRIYVPYTSVSKVAVYHSVIMPLAVPGQQNLVTRLKVYPQYSIASPTLRWVGELRKLPEGRVVDATDIL